jgi:FeS assembly SUF system protein
MSDEPTTPPATQDPTSSFSAPPSPEQSSPEQGASAAAGAPSEAPNAGETGLRDRIIEQLRTVYDPEIPVNIYEMGLIYEIDVDDAGATKIIMTLTTPMCPAAEELPAEVESKARGVEGVSSVQLDLVWDPPWNPDMMSEAAKLELGMV